MLADKYKNFRKRHPSHSLTTAWKTAQARTVTNGPGGQTRDPYGLAFRTCRMQGTGAVAIKVACMASGHCGPCQEKSGGRIKGPELEALLKAFAASDPNLYGEFQITKVSQEQANTEKNTAVMYNFHQLCRLNNWSMTDPGTEAAIEGLIKMGYYSRSKLGKSDREAAEAAGTQCN